MAQSNAIQRSFTVGTVSDAVVAVKLLSIEHVAEKGDEVDIEFNVEVTISDGINDLGKFQPENKITIQPGKKFLVQKTIFVGEYEDKCNKDVGEITFKFEVETDQVAAEFEGKTVGSNALKSAGTFQFVAPVVIEQGSRKSTIIFRGRIDVSC